MGASIRVGKVFGIPIEINASWVPIFLLLTFVLARRFGEAGFDWPVAQQWTVAVVVVVLLFLSVLAHELSHSVIAKAKGIPVHGITLFLFGGVSRLGREPSRPSVEFSVAVVGPLCSIVLSAVVGGVWYLFDWGDSPIGVVLFLLSWTNLSLGVFNILPGYPLDGGRILRAAVWGLTGNYRVATRVATRAGQAIGGLTVLGGVSLGVFEGALSGIWIAIVGGFLFSVATTSYRNDVLAEREREGEKEKSLEQYRDLEWLRPHRVGDMVLRPQRPMLSKETPLSSPLVAQALAGENDCLIVLSGGQPEGVVTRYDLMQVPVDARSATPLAQVAAPLASLARVALEDTIFELVKRMETEGLDRVVVAKRGVLVGFISRLDVLRHLDKIRAGTGPY